MIFMARAAAGRSAPVGLGPWQEVSRDGLGVGCRVPPSRTAAAAAGRARVTSSKFKFDPGRMTTGVQFSGVNHQP